MPIKLQHPELQAIERPIINRLAEHILQHQARVDQAPLSAPVSPLEIRAHLETRYGFERPMAMPEVFDDVTAMLWNWSEHARNPMHFGLTRPTIDIASLVADALVALYDPNLATWDFSPAANEIERYVLDVLGRSFGYPPGAGINHFTSGGQEANHTAVAVALSWRFPELGHQGLRSLAGQPVFYLSREGHHSFEKVAHVTGLGRDALRIVPVLGDLTMDIDALEGEIARDRRAGNLPFMVVGTAGTTSAGAIDPLDEMAEIAQRHGLWFHADAAWGGAAALSDRLRPLLAGIERTHSITFDAHKWLSVPVGAGAFFCRHREAVESTFAIDAAYVPARTADGRVYPLATSLQWSRRFIGLKVFMMLALRGLPEIVSRIERQADLALVLAELLAERGWRILNRPDLAIVCFTHPRIEAGKIDPADIVRTLKESHTAWISQTVLAGNLVALRASITNFATERHHVERLVAALERTL